MMSEQSTQYKPKQASTKTANGPGATKTLVIAEKPSVARDIVKCLGNTFVEVDKGYWENERYVVSFAIGHLLTIAKPAEIDPKYKGGWSMNVLPMIPSKFPLEPTKNGKSQLSVLEKIIKRSDITEIINACDAGREGELIFHYILDYIRNKNKKPVLKEKKISRLWLQSMTENAMRTAFSQLRDHSEMKNLEDAARSRSEADWLIGMNSSRGLTAFNSRYGGFQITPSGRVQTPTLSMLVSRERLISKFKPHTYFTLVGHFYNSSLASSENNAEIEKISIEAKWIDEGFKKDPNDIYNEKKRDRIFKEEKAQSIVQKCSGKPTAFTETKRKSSERSPMLYDLTSLQREANARFGFSAKATLGLAQALYEKHKATTYPRTSSKYLPSDYVSVVKRTFSEILKSKYDTLNHLKPLIKKAETEGMIKHIAKVFNDKKISDHHAIIPTQKAASKLSEPETKIYLMIVERFLAAFFPAAEYEKVERRFEVADEVFISEGKVLITPGWRAVYGKKIENGETQPLAENAKVLCHKVISNQAKTLPPARFNEATLLGAMENAGKQIEDEALAEAMRERGLGTPATRAAIIEKLISDKYVVKEVRDLIPTTKAFELFNLIEAMKIVELSSPELTGNWEYKLALIEKGSLPREEFMKEIKNGASQIVERIKEFDEDSGKVEASFSPVNGDKYYELLTRYCNEDKTVQIKKIIGGRILSGEEVKQLLQNGKVGPFHNFRARTGNNFSASIVLDEKRKPVLQFLNDSDDLDDFNFNKAKLIGHYYVDGSAVYATETSYLSKSYIDKDKSNAADVGVRLSRFILGKEIEEKQAQLIISGEKSELIKGFKSTKTKRLFDAFLQLDEKGKIVFSFPERKKKTTGTAK